MIADRSAGIGSSEADVRNINVNTYLYCSVKLPLLLTIL